MDLPSAYRIIKIDHEVATSAAGKLYRREDPFMLFVQEGTAEVQIQISRVHLRQNSVLLGESRSVHRVLEISDNFRGYMVVYKPTYLQKLGIKLNKLKVFQHFRSHLKDTTVFPANEVQFICDQLAVLDQLPEEIPFFEEISDHLFSGFIYTFAGSMLRQEQAGNYRLNRQEEITFRFVQDVAAHFKTERKLSFYADRQHMTVRHLSAVVKTVTNKSAQEIVAEFLMNEARILLEKTKLTISEIAGQLRFSDAYAFSHFFKKHGGVSPKQYRLQ